jgi:hypothetical protein
VQNAALQLDLGPELAPDTRRPRRLRAAD